MKALSMIIGLLMTLFVVMSSVASAQTAFLRVSYDFTKLPSMVEDAYNAGTYVTDTTPLTAEKGALAHLGDRIGGFTVTTLSNTAQATPAGKFLWFCANLIETSLRNLGIIRPTP